MALENPPYPILDRNNSFAPGRHLLQLVDNDVPKGAAFAALAPSPPTLAAAVFIMAMGSIEFKTKNKLIK